MKKFTGLGKLSLFGSAFLWGFGFIAVENALRSGWNPMLLLATRGLLGAILLHSFAYKRLYWKNKAMLKDGILAGIYLTIAFVGQTYGQALSGPANAAFITALYVIFTPILLSIRHHRWVSKTVLVAAIIAFIGVALISVKDTVKINPGDIYLILGAIMFAIHILKLEDISHYDDALSLTTIQLITMSVCSFAFVPFLNVTFTTQGIGFVLYSGLISSGIAFFLQTFGQKHVNAPTASIILTFEAIFGVLGAVLFLQEIISQKMLLGGFLLIGSVFFVELMPNYIVMKNKASQ